MTTDTTEKKLPKHLQAAVNQLQKQATKYAQELQLSREAKRTAEDAIAFYEASIESLEEQINKLKG